MPKVSVIINCYNGEEFLAETLASLKAQTFTDYELVFWDNCSTDRTPEIAKSFDERLRYFRGDTLIPLGAARNKALEQVQGEYIAFLDSDDLWEPDKLARQVAVLDETPDCGMVLSNFKRLNMLSGETDVFHPDAQTCTKTFTDFLLQYDYALSSFLIRRTALEGLDHYFDGRLKYAEEYELFIRIAYRWNAVYLAEPLATYRLHNGMATVHLRARMAEEYDITLDNLRAMIDDFDAQYPQIVYHIHYLRDFSIAKDILPKGENRRVRTLMKPYWSYNIRAKCYYLAACAPVWLSRLAFRTFYRKRI